MDVQTVSTYNQMAKEYDEETTDFWQRFPRTVLDRFAAQAKGKVLDVGSGPGRDGLLLRERGLEVVCLDASEVMVNLCREKGLKAIAGDFNYLQFEDNYFDGVWAYTSLLHAKKSEVSQPLTEIRRVLKSNGILGLGLIEGETETYQESSGVKMPRWFSFYKKEEAEELLRKNGFTVIYFEQFKPNTRNYLNFIAQRQ